MKNSHRTLGIGRQSYALAIVRVSTAEQAHEERYSIPHQRTHITEECQHRDLDLVHFCEFVQSGAKVLANSSKERAEVLKYITDYSISVVVVHELDRLARSMLDTLLFVDQLDRLGITLISIHDGFDTSTPQGKLQMQILAAFAEYFRQQLAGKVLGGMLERAKEGKPMGRRPLGYQIGTGGFVIDKDEAVLIRLIYSMYLEQNIGLRGIADHLNSMGVKSLRGNVWSHVSVREVIENEVYAGTFSWGDIRIENNHPAIIDRPTWEEVQRRRRRKKELGGRAQNQLYILSGLVRCECGATMVGRTARKGKYTYKYYVCNDYASKGMTTCPGGYHRAGVIENMVMEHIREFSRRKKVSTKKDMVPADISILKEQLELKQKELTNLKTMLIRAAEAYERGMYDLEWFSMRKEKINEDKAAVASEIKLLDGKIKGDLSPAEMGAKISEKVELARELLKEKDPIRVKARLQGLIDTIIIKKDESIIIRYRY